MDKYFFRNRLKDLYDFSIIKNEYGRGKVFLKNDLLLDNIEWQLNMDLSGVITIVIYTKNQIEKCNDEGFIEYTLKGETNNNNWIIIGEGVCFNRYEYNTEKNYYIYIGEAKDIELQNKKYNKVKKDKLYIKAAINNFNFKGLEYSDERNEKDKFKVNILGRGIEFKLGYNAKKILKILEDRYINGAIMSYLTFDLQECDDKEKVFELIDDISWFLCLINLNSTFSPYVELITNNEVIYKRLTCKMLNYKYSQNCLIDNFYIPNGLKNIFENNFSEYVTQARRLDLKKVIHTLLKIEQEQVIEFKLAFLILAYEQVTTKFLLSCGIEEEKVKNYNIQQKIQQVNSVLKFIPSKSQGADLRENVRNDIFHLGELPLLNYEEKMKIFLKYYELLYRIILRIIGYKGKYISRETYEEREV